MRLICTQPFEVVNDDGTTVKATPIIESRHEEGGEVVEHVTLGFEITTDADVITINPCEYDLETQGDPTETEENGEETDEEDGEDEEGEKTEDEGEKPET